MAQEKERLIAIFHAAAVFFLLLTVLLRPLVCGLSGGLGFNILVALPLLGAAFLWLMAMVMRQELRFCRTAMDRPILLLVLFTLASVILAAYKHAAASVAFDWLCYILLFYVVLNLCAEMPRLVVLVLLALLASTFVVSLNGLVQHFYSLKLTHDLFLANQEKWALSLGLPRDAIPDFIGRMETGRVFSSFLLPNTCAGFLGVMIPAQIGFLVHGGAGGRLRGPRRITFIALNAVLLLTALICLYCTKSKGGWISLAIVIVAFAAVSGRRILARYWAWGLGVVAAAVLLFAALQLTHRAPPIDEYFESFSVRTQYWRAGALIIKDHPWFGVGLNNFGEFYPEYRRPQDDESLMAHNNYIQVWAETGIFGFLSFCAVWVAFFYSMRHVRSSGLQAASGTVPADTVPRLLAVFAALIGFAMIYFMFFSLDRSLIVGFALGWGVAYFLNERCTAARVPAAPPKEDAGTGQANALRLGIIFGVLFFLIHSLADFDLYEQGLAQTVWLLMAIGLAWDPSRLKVARIRIGSTGQVLVAAPVIILMGVLLCFVAPRFLEAKIKMEDGRDFLAAKEDQKAIPQWLEAARLDPWDSEIQMALAEILYAEWRKDVREYEGKPTLDLALLHVQRAIELNPRRPRYHHFLARLYDETSRQQTSPERAVALRREALSEYEQAYKLFPTRAPYAADLAFAYDAVGRHAEALRFYNTALELDEYARPERSSTTLSPDVKREIQQRLEKQKK